MTNQQALPHWSTKTSILPIVAGLVCLLTALGMFVLTRQRTQEPVTRRPSRIILPVGFTGNIKITYEVPNMPPIREEGGYLIYEIPPGGLIETSSKPVYGHAIDILERKLPDGGVETLNMQYFKEHKVGMTGDTGEFFVTALELERRDKIMKTRGEMDDTGKVLTPRPYEIMVIRNDFEKSR